MRISDWSSDVCSSDLKRNPLKRGKDQIQDTALLDAVRERMPQFPLDHAFENGLPEELRGFYEGWMETVGSVASGTAPPWSTAQAGSGPSVEQVDVSAPGACSPNAALAQWATGPAIPKYGEAS